MLFPALKPALKEHTDHTPAIIKEDIHCLSLKSRMRKSGSKSKKNTLGYRNETANAACLKIHFFLQMEASLRS